jgi:hypothetical protein
MRPMDASPSRPWASKSVRLAVAMAYAAVMIWIVPKGTMAPALHIALGLPFIFRLVPRNWLYGLRTPHTMWTTEETWYRQNLITGVAMVLAGAIWMVVIALR